MSNFDDTFEAVAAPVAEAEHGVTVVFSRGGSSSASFTATAQDVSFEVVGESGFRIQVDARSFILPVASVALSGSPVEPRPGDRLTFTQNGTQVVFQIMKFDDDTPPVSLLAGGYRWRVYAKQVS
jgi:hypothetical protein